MSTSSLLFVVLVVEAALLIVGCTALLTHAVWRSATRSGRRARDQRARAYLAAALDGDSVALDPHSPALLALRPGARAVLLTDLASSVTGTHRERLAELATRVGLLDRARDRCASRWWWRRLDGARLLTALACDDPVMVRLLEDEPNADVRAQAVVWAADHPRREIVGRLVGLLDDPKPLVRFSVADALLRIGRPSVGALIELLGDDSASALARIGALRVARYVAEAPLLDVALLRSHDDDARVRALAAGVIGALGGERAVERLTELVADPHGNVRAAASEALGRLGHWPAAPALAQRVGDHEWLVRQRAAMALRALGSPGLLLLQRLSGDSDRFAADMARQVLDMPDTHEAGAQR